MLLSYVYVPPQLIWILQAQVDSILLSLAAPFDQLVEFHPVHHIIKSFHVSFECFW